MCRHVNDTCHVCMTTTVELLSKFYPILMYNTGYWRILSHPCHAPLVTPPSSRARHALVTPFREGVTVWNAWHYYMYTKSLSGLLCCSCATGKQADCRATRGPGRAGKHTFSVKSSSFKLKSNENLLRQPQSFGNAKKGLLPGFKMRYLPIFYSQNWWFKLRRKQENNFCHISVRSCVI